MVKEELIKLSKSCAFTSGIGSRNVLNDSSTSPDTAFFLAYISEESDRFFHENFITDVSVDKEVPVK